jgi:hypothetical protein
MNRTWQQTSRNDFDDTSLYEFTSDAVRRVITGLEQRHYEEFPEKLVLVSTGIIKIELDCEDDWMLSLRFLISKIEPGIAKDRDALLFCFRSNLVQQFF